jgi:Holliday junction resolvase-like predicted endonuclease
VTAPPSNSKSAAQRAIELEALSADAKGRAGEASAKAWLQAQGYQVLAERFRRRNGVAGEIDLIVIRDATLSFVEVKSHQSETAALEAITARARAHRCCCRGLAG